MQIDQTHLDAAVINNLTISRLQMVSECGTSIEKKFGPVWLDPFMIEPYLIYNFCTNGFSPDLSEKLMTACMKTDLLRTFYHDAHDTMHKEQIVSLVIRNSSVSHSHIHNNLLKVCAPILESIDTDGIVSFLKPYLQKGTRIVIGTAGSKTYDNREVDGSVLHPLFQRRKPNSSLILEDQMLFQVALPFVFLDHKGAYLNTRRVTMLRLTVCGPSSSWNRFTLRPKTHRLRYPTFADLAYHLTTPFLTHIGDQRKAHSSILFLIMSFLHEQNGSLADLIKWNPWVDTIDSPFLTWGASRLRWFRDSLHRESIAQSKQFVQRVTFLYSNFVLCLLLNRHVSFPEVTYITPQSIEDDER